MDEFSGKIQVDHALKVRYGSFHEEVVTWHFGIMKYIFPNLPAFSHYYSWGLGEYWNTTLWTMSNSGHSSKYSCYQRCENAEKTAMFFLKKMADLLFLKTKTSITF